MLKHTFPCKGANVDCELDETKLPAATISYLLSYGFKQCLADSYAGAENETEAKASFEKKLKALKEGTASERASPIRDPFAAMVRNIASELVDDAAKKKKVKLEKDHRNTLIASAIEKHREEIETEAKKRLKAVSKVNVEIEL